MACPPRHSRHAAQGSEPFKDVGKMSPKMLNDDMKKERVRAREVFLAMVPRYSMSI
jgi:hypothetical protein